MVSSPTTRTCWLLILGLLLLRIAGAKKLALHLAREEELEQLEELVRLLPDEPDKDRELVAALRKLQLDAEQVMRHRQRASGSDEPEVVLMQDHLHQEQQARHRWEVYKHVTKPDTDNYEYTGTKKPVIIYPKGVSSSDSSSSAEKARRTGKQPAGSGSSHESPASPTTAARELDTWRCPSQDRPRSGGYPPAEDRSRFYSTRVSEFFALPGTFPAPIESVRTRPRTEHMTLFT